MREMVGGCCVCSDERGWPENPLVYCDGQNCTVAVHQACYGIVTVPTGPWFCRKCESQERSARVRCELCPSRDGALKKTDNQGWAHVVCALYIPEVRFGNVSTMEPIILALIPPERYSKACYICADSGKGSKANAGACMQCNKSGCKQQFHVTCAQQLGLLCEEAGNYLDNVKYCGYCQHHYSKLKKGGNVKPIPPYKPISHDTHSSDSPSSPEKESELSHSSSRSNRPTIDPLATPNPPSGGGGGGGGGSSSGSSKQKKSSNPKGSSSSSSATVSSNAQIPFSSSSNTSQTTNMIPASNNNTSSSSRTSSSSTKDKEKDGKHGSSGNSGAGSSSSKNVNKISSSTNNKHDKDSSSYSSYSTSGSSRDKNKSSSSSSKSSHQNMNASNKDDGVTSNSHNSKGSSSSSSSSHFSTSTGTIRITTSSATPTSPVSTIIHKHDGNNSNSNNSSTKDVVQSSGNSIMSSSQNQNSSKGGNNDDNHSGSDEVRGGKMSSSWHQNSGMTAAAHKAGISSSSYSSSITNTDGTNDGNDSSKTNFSAMTKKRKAMHQANSSNRSSADENVNKDICKDLSVKVVPIDKLDPSVSEFERHYKKARTDLNSQATPAIAAAATTQEPNIQNVNPNVVLHSSTSTVASNAAPHISSPPASTSSSLTTSSGVKSQVITQNIQVKSSSNNVNMKEERQQEESLVVSVPLSSATTVPGIQMPTNSNSNNINTSNSSTVSTIVTNQAQMQAASPATMSVTSSSLLPSSHGSLYQHLTNNQRASPLVVPVGSAALVHDSHSSSNNNHTSVLQNINSGGVISSAASFHGPNLLNETSPAAMLKVQYEKQPISRVHAIQQEGAQTGRRSRSQSEKDANNSAGSGGNTNKKGNSKKRTNNSSSSTVSSNVVEKNKTDKTDNASHTARTHSNHKSNRSNNSKNNHNNSNNNLGGSVGAQSTNDVGGINSGNNATTIIATSSSSSATSTIVKLSPAPASTGSARTSSPIVNVTIMKKYRDEPSTSRTPDVSNSIATTIAAPISAGGLKFAFEPQTNQSTSSGLLINTNTQAYHPPTMKDSPQSSPSGSEISSARKRRKGTPQQSPHAGSGFEHKREREEKETKLLQNGAILPPSTASSFPTHHMLGNQINPSGNYAKNMTETLNMEIEAHSIFANDVATTNLIGPQYPGRKDSNKASSNSSSTTTSSGPASLTSMLSGSSTSNGAPQSLEQLLERQWEQGSQFLMEQAQHFDIASLLSCLHQLKIENSRLEDHINSLVSRRDHLLAVNARLAIPLGQPTASQATLNGPLESSSAPQQQQQPTQQQQQQPPQVSSASVANKRSVPANSINPVSTIQIPSMENGLDYRGGHHPISSSSSTSTSSSHHHHQHQQQQQQQQQQHQIRHPATAVSKGNLISSQVVTIDQVSSNNPQQSQAHHQFQSNAQFQQQMYHQQQPITPQQQQQASSHVNSSIQRARQSNSYQSQQSAYSQPPSVHKTKN